MSTSIRDGRPADRPTALSFHHVIGKKIRSRRESAPPSHLTAEVPPAGWTRRIASLLTISLWALTFICSITAIIPPLGRMVSGLLNWLDTYTVSTQPNVALAVFYGLLASVVSARKRSAWWVVMLALTLSVALNIWATILFAQLATGFGSGVIRQLLVGCIFPVLLIAVLIGAHREFTTRVRTRALPRAVLVLVVGVVLATLIAWALIALDPGTVAPHSYFGWALNRVTGGWLSQGAALADPDNTLFNFLYVVGGAPDIVEFLGGLVGGLALAAAFFTLFRSQTPEAVLTADDEVRIRNLLAEFGAADSLAYFATRRDKRAIFAANGRAAISYRVQGGVSLASGDPIGDPDAWPQAIDAWKTEAADFGWPLAVMGASEFGATAFNKAGLGAIQLGDEAVLRPKTFNVDSPEMKPVRQAVNRAVKAGATVIVQRHSELTESQMSQALTMADQWRDTDEERGFSMALGRLGDPNDGDCLLVQAFGSDGTPLGVLSLSPWGADGVSLDLMRRNPQAPNGTMELMVSELLRQGTAKGISRVSLNFAVFRSAFEEGARIGAGPILRLWRRILLFFSRWWQLEALYRSNVKYNPEWYPRFLCYSDVRNLARISLASGMAEGYVDLPFSTFKQREIDAAKPIPLLPGVVSVLSKGAPTTMRRGRSAANTPEQVGIRFAKVDRLRAAGLDPYPVAMPPSATVASLSAIPLGTHASAAGRLILIRNHGGVIFARLRDWSGDVQLIIERDKVGRDRLKQFAADFDLGDLVTVSGEMTTSHSGQQSFAVQDWRLIGKCLRPMPNKWRGLTDPEARIRSRYVDLAVNSDTRALTKARSAALRSLRESLYRRDFLEVETPILQQVHGGANARPFTTHINAYDVDLYLRIAPELYLKRLCVGGMDKVFEIGRTFRNEGADWKHNPEFTMLEAYEANSDYTRMLDTCRELIQEAAMAAHGEQIALRPDPGGCLVPVDISGQWAVKTMHGGVAEALGEEVTPQTSRADLVRLCDRAKIAYRPEWDAGQVALEMYEQLVEGQTETPTFYQNFPVSVSPLTRSHRSIPGVAERWDLVAWGVELATAYSELTDPIEQRKRLTAQSLLAAGGDPEAMELDEDFLTALEYAMPPTGGLGMGVDRMVMLLTGRSIRETLPFPLAKLR